MWRSHEPAVAILASCSESRAGTEAIGRLSHRGDGCRNLTQIGRYMFSRRGFCGTGAPIVLIPERPGSIVAALALLLQSGCVESTGGGS